MFCSRGVAHSAACSSVQVRSVFGAATISLRQALRPHATRTTLRSRPIAAAGPSSRFAHAAVAAPEKVEASSRAGMGSPDSFDLVKQQYIEEYDSQVLLYKHRKTGAELMSVINKDENKTFGATLRTPVENSKGIPHILEHSVLCGSRKYPIKEPFVELIKGSLNTFLNAFTYPDRTCYPVASANLQDFYNLVDVYLDAVLHPKCIDDPHTFAQEGWHYELEDPKDTMTFKGVVFNEMKGVYSSPDSAHSRVTQTAMFPDNTYAVDSGGDPTVIPELTYEEFKAFHGRFYHPSNARFWFYGDDDPQERLRVLDSYLDEFDARPVDSTVGTQPLFSEPRAVTGKYVAGQGSGEAAEAEKAFVSLNWVLSEDVFDVETQLEWGFLDYLLLGTSAAPLRKALNDSGLGEALIGGGLMDELRQPVFSVGLKGVDPANADKVEQLIVDEITRLSQTGFSSTAIEAAVNSIEFSLKENNTGSFPRGLSLMLRSLSAWIYDKDPFEPLQWKEDLQRLKDRLASGDKIFEPLLEKYLLKNTHKISARVLPDKQLAAQQEEAEKLKLAERMQHMSESEKDAAVQETADLKLRQETPDTPEALACVPSLHLEDIPREASRVPTEIVQIQGVDVLQHELSTNDVLYAQAALDMHSVPANLLPLVPLFCRCLTQMGTQKESFVELTDRIGRKTGGVSVSPFTSSVRGQADPAAFLMVSGKSTSGNAGGMLELFRDILLTARLDDQARFKQMALETRAGLESGIIGGGHRVVARRLGAQRSTAGWVGEQMGGLSYLQYIRQLVPRIESDWEGVKADLEAIRSALLQRRGALINLTGDEATLSAARPLVSDFLESLPAEAAGPADWNHRLDRLSEAICVPTQVNYVGKSVNLYEDAGYKLHGSAYVINQLLGTSWLWDRVRVSGGAYGGFSSFDSHSGLFTFLSYRDPNLLKTADVYDGTADFLRQLQLDQDALTKAVIGTIGDIDSYQLPDAKGSSAFSDHILGNTHEKRQARREEVLGTSLQDFREFAEVLDCVSGPQARVAAVTSLERANAVNEKERPGFFDKVHQVL